MPPFCVPDVVVWTSEEGNSTVADHQFVVRNLYSFTNEWGKNCTDNADIATAFAVARMPGR